MRLVEQGKQQPPGIFGRQRRAGRLRQNSRDAQCSGHFRDKQQIRGTTPHGISQQGIERAQIDRHAALRIVRIGNGTVQLR
jgi:hypothetical protein